MGSSRKVRTQSPSFVKERDNGLSISSKQRAIRRSARAEPVWENAGRGSPADKKGLDSFIQALLSVIEVPSPPYHGKKEAPPHSCPARAALAATRPPSPRQSAAGRPPCP